VHLAQQDRLLRRRPLSCRDIAGDLGGAEDLAGRVANRRNSQRDLDELPILAAANRLEMVDTLTGAQPAQDALLLMVPIFRDNQCDGFSDRLVGRVAE